MDTTLILTLSIAAFLLALGLHLRRRALTGLANVAEGTHKGKKTYLADEVVATRYLLAKVGSSDAHCGINDASDIPLGVMDDEASAIGLPINLNLLGSTNETQLMVAGAGIADGEFVIPAADGKVIKLPVAAGTYYVVGRALTTVTTDGDLVEVDPCLPYPVVVTE